MCLILPVNGIRDLAPHFSAPGQHRGDPPVGVPARAGSAVRSLPSSHYLRRYHVEGLDGRDAKPLRRSCPARQAILRQRLVEAELVAARSTDAVHSGVALIGSTRWPQRLPSPWRPPAPDRCVVAASTARRRTRVVLNRLAPFFSWADSSFAANISAHSHLAVVVIRFCRSSVCRTFVDRRPDAFICGRSFVSVLNRRRRPSALHSAWDS